MIADNRKFRNKGQQTIACAAMLSFAAPAYAQNFDQIAPKPVPQTQGPAPTITAPGPTAAQGKPDQLLLPALKGLVLIDSAAKLRPQGAPTPAPFSGQPELRGSQDSGIRIENLPLLDQVELRDQLAGFIGKKVTFGDLAKISQIIVAWYRGHDYPFVDVVFPDQDINSV